MTDLYLRLYGRLRGAGWREAWLFRQLLAHAGEDFLSLWLCRDSGADHEIVAWNCEAERLYGIPRRYALGKSYVRLIVSEPERAEALITTDETIHGGVVWRNYLNRDIRHDGSEVLTLTQNVRLWNPFDGEFQFAEVGLDVSDLFESEHALVERRAERRLSVNEMARLALLQNSLAATRYFTSVSDVARVITGQLATALGPGCATTILLCTNEAIEPRLLSTHDATTGAIDAPVSLIEAAQSSPGILVMQSPAPAETTCATALRVAISPEDAVIITALAPDNARTDRSTMYLEAIFETCANALHHWSMHAALWDPGQRGSSTMALVEADLVASELGHVVKNRLSTIQIVLHRLQTDVQNGATDGLAEGLGQLSDAVQATAAQLRHAQNALSADTVLVSSLISHTITRSGAPPSWITVQVDPPDMTLEGPSFSFNTILINLVTNALDAVAAGPNRQEPGICIKATEPTPGVCELQVHDNGQGVPSHITASLYERGFTTKGPDHLGYGLHHVMRAVQAAQGQLRLPATSEILGGACFSVSYPLRGAAESEIA